MDLSAYKEAMAYAVQMILMYVCFYSFCHKSQDVAPRPKMRLSVTFNLNNLKHFLSYNLRDFISAEMNKYRVTVS